MIMWLSKGLEGVEKKEINTHSTSEDRFSTISRTWSNFVVKRLSAVKMPPLGPRLYLGPVEHLFTYSIWTGCTLFHDLLVVYRIADVDVGIVGDVSDGWVEVEDVWRFGGRRGVAGAGSEVAVDALHECGLACASHADGDDRHGGRGGG